MQSIIDDSKNLCLVTQVSHSLALMQQVLPPDMTPIPTHFEQYCPILVEIQTHHASFSALAKWRLFRRGSKFMAYLG